MGKILTALLEFLNKYGYNFITAGFLACVTVFVLYMTKYPYIFKLWETKEGELKFLLFLCTLVFFYLIVCVLIVKTKKFINQKTRKNQKASTAISNLKTMLDNKTTYQDELYILAMLAGKKISCFDMDTLIRIYQEFNPNSSTEGLWDKLEGTLWNLVKLNIINMAKINFYSIDKDIFEKVIEEMKNGYSK